MFTAYELAMMISDVLIAHQEHPKKPEKAFRVFDGVTPFGVHETLLAMLFLNEEHLSEKTRVLGAKVLLGHEMMEDFSLEFKLPDWTKEPEVEKLINELTFQPGEDKYALIFGRSEMAILLEFFDCVMNLTCVGTKNPDRRAKCEEAVRRLLAYIEPHYPKLEIIKMAKAFLLAAVK